jgi:hypothetical protein
MPTYRVRLKREVEQEATVTVNADSPDEAEDLALGLSARWQDTGFVAGPWTIGAEEEDRA